MNWQNIVVRAVVVFFMAFFAYIPASAISDGLTWDIFSAALLAGFAALISFLKNSAREYKISKG